MKRANASVERFSGFAETYDRFRPTPPEVLPYLLIDLAGERKPELVVDLGCGTGLATRIWAEMAQQVIGIEPSADMRQLARQKTPYPNIAYLEGLSHKTNLPDASADIVTASQALHWMAPGPTFKEVRRVLRPGGVFVAIDCDWPPTVGSLEAEEAYKKFGRQIAELGTKHGICEGLRRWPKAGHLKRMQKSGMFRFTKEILLHNIEKGNADRLVGLAMSMGSVAGLLKKGLTPKQTGLEELRDAANRLLGSQPRDWYFSYRIRVGVV